MIYNKFFGFREEPFGLTPNPKFLYMSKNHEEAIAHLNFGISENKGFIMLTGEVGSGKTGELDEETAIMLSNTEGAPKLVPE